MLVAAPTAALFEMSRLPPTITEDWLRPTFGLRQRLPATYIRDAPWMLLFRVWSHVLPVWPAQRQSQTGVFKGCVVVGVTVPVAWGGRVRVVLVRFGFVELPIEVRYQRASLRTSVPHQSTVPPSIVVCFQVDVAVRVAAGSVYFFSFVVHLGRVSGSSALFVGTVRIDIELFIPASASAKADCRVFVCAACV